MINLIFRQEKPPKGLDKIIVYTFQFAIKTFGFFSLVRICFLTALLYCYREFKIQSAVENVDICAAGMFTGQSKVFAGNTADFDN